MLTLNEAYKKKTTNPLSSVWYTIEYQTFEKFLRLLVKAPLNHFIHREIQYQHKNKTI